MNSGRMNATFSYPFLFSPWLKAKCICSILFLGLLNIEQKEQRHQQL